MTELPKLTCDCCRKNEAVGVASSAFGAISFAYCSECLGKPADCEMMFAHLYYDVSNRGAGLRPEIDEWFTYMNDQYVSWPDYVKIQHEKEANENQSNSGRLDDFEKSGDDPESSASDNQEPDRRYGNGLED